MDRKAIPLSGATLRAAFAVVCLCAGALRAQTPGDDPTVPAPQPAAVAPAPAVVSATAAPPAAPRPRKREKPAPPPAAPAIEVAAKAPAAPPSSAARADAARDAAAAAAAAASDPTIAAPAAPAAPGAPPAAAAAQVTGPARFGILLPPERSGELLTHWAQRREYLRDRDERRAADEEQSVRELKKELAIDNLFVIGAALVRESHEALAAGSPTLAHKRCALAVELAPALPDAHFCLGRALLAEEGASLGQAFAELVAGVKAAREDPRVRRATLANAGCVLMIGVLLAGVAFATLLLARYLQLYVHDVHHLFPAGARRWQTNLLAAVLVVSPLLLQMGPVPLLFTALAACAIYASALEVIVGCAVLATVALAPVATEGLARLAAFGGPAADVYLLEKGEGSPASVARLQRRLEGQQPEFAVAFTLARKAKREGDLGAAQALYGRAIESSGASNESLAAAHNNLGNVHLLSGDGPRATAQYVQAIELQDSLAAAHFNLSRALNLGGVEALDKVQAEQQRAMDLDRAGIDVFTEGNLQLNRHSNRFAMDVALPEASLAPLEASEIAMASAVGDEAGAAMAGPLPAVAAPVWPILSGLAFVALWLVRARLKPSGRCDRCGREVCKRCDSDARPQEALCAQCVNVFVRRTNVDPAERIRKEIAVHLYQRRRALVVRLMGVLSGAGHVLMGYPLRGVVYLGLTGSLIASVLLWRGVAHDPIAVRSGVSLLRVAVTAAVFVAVYAVCLRDLVARQRAEGG